MMLPRLSRSSTIVAALLALLLGVYGSTSLQLPGYQTIEQFANTLRQSILGSGRASRPLESNWNILYHLGGNGPWIEKTNDIVDGGIEPPPGCRIDQVHMVSRSSALPLLLSKVVLPRSQGMRKGTQHIMPASVRHIRSLRTHEHCKTLCLENSFADYLDRNACPVSETQKCRHRLER